MSLLFNMLSRLVIIFLPRSKCFLISWLQSPSAVILEPPKIKSLTVSTVSPSIFHEVMEPEAIIFIFWMLSLRNFFSLLFHFHEQALWLFFTFCHKGGVICTSEVIDISPSNQACVSSSPVFLMMYSACKLNKQGDNIQPWHTLFPIWNQPVVPCPVLTVASWPAYRFLKRQVTWSGIPISFRIFQFVVIHIIEGFRVVNKAEIDVFLEFPCFFNDNNI